MKVLFLLRKSSNYSFPQKGGSKAGLFNSARITKDQIVKYLGVEAELRICVDANQINKEINDYRPAIVILEALWVTPEKMKELSKLWPKVLFVVRIHSEIPFLAHEGIAIEWIKGYQELHNVAVSFNTIEAYTDFSLIFDKKSLYLPNIYEDIKVYNPTTFNRIRGRFKKIFKPDMNVFKSKKVIDIGCFGAIRPMKNHLFQAFVAMHLGNLFNKKVRFHINASRTEHGGESVLKNLKALFEGSKHELVEHGWLSREEFLELIEKMDAGMQLSFNESFNIVAADFVQKGVPIIVSETIHWMPDFTKASTSDSQDALMTLLFALNKENKFVTASKIYLNDYNKKAIKAWAEFLIKPL